MLALVLACASPSDAPSTSDLALADGKAVIAEGSPEALGVLAMLNDPSTTMTALDVHAALDKRAAEGILAHRDGPTASNADDNPFGTVQELDDVKYVGDAALAQVLAYATAEGWVAVDDDYYGTIEGVSFTRDEAAAIVDLVNTADLETLDDDVALDSRAANNLVAGRPFAALEDVARVSYVGTSALSDLKEWVDAATIPTLTTDAAVATLTADVAGLWFTSESDFPLVVWKIVDPSTTELTSSNVTTILASAYVYRSGTTALADRSVEASSLPWVFDRYTVPEGWWDESYYAAQPQWQTVRDVFEDQLDAVTVWRFGRRNSSDLVGDIDVFVVGVSADGDLVGISTVSVET